jgi:hypothetical protein
MSEVRAPYFVMLAEVPWDEVPDREQDRLDHELQYRADDGEFSQDSGDETVIVAQLDQLDLEAAAKVAAG